VSISVESEGDETERSSSFKVNVNAPTAEEEPPMSDGEEDDTSLLPESSSLPWLPLIDVLAVFAVVSVVALRPRS